MEPSPATPTAVSTGHDASPSPREAGVPTPAPSAKKTAKKDREAASSMSVSHFGEEHARLQADEKSAAVYYATQKARRATAMPLQLGGQRRPSRQPVQAPEGLHGL